MKTLTTYYEKSVCRCDLPISKAQWAEVLRDSKVTTPERLETLFRGERMSSGRKSALALSYGTSFLDAG